MSQIIPTTSALISPDGKFYAVPVWSHWEFAMENFGKELSYLCRKENWIHISDGDIHCDNPAEITNSQIDTLYNLLSVIDTPAYHAHFERELNYLINCA